MIPRDAPIDAAAAQRAVREIPGLPCDAEGPVFAEPWHAQAFALTVALHERGLFTWPEWAAALAAEIKAAQRSGDPDLGDTYYLHWLAALERLICDKHAASETTLAAYRDAWERAANRTPHGRPIELKPDDFADCAARGSEGRAS